MLDDAPPTSPSSSVLSPDFSPSATSAPARPDRPALKLGSSRPAPALKLPEPSSTQPVPPADAAARTPGWMTALAGLAAAIAVSMAVLLFFKL